MKISNIKPITYQKPVKNNQQNNLAFTNRIRMPQNYTVVSPHLMATGGLIEHPDTLRFLVNNGYRSVVSFIDPNIEGNDIYLHRENSLIKDYNEKNPNQRIETSSINIFHDRAFREKVSRREYDDPIVVQKTQDLDKLLNGLPAPVYGHCICGDNCSSLVADVVKREIQQGKIIT